MLIVESVNIYPSAVANVVAGASINAERALGQHQRPSIMIGEM